MDHEWTTELKRKGGPLFFTTLAIRGNQRPDHYDRLFDVSFTLDNWKYVGADHVFDRHELAALERSIQRERRENSGYFQDVIDSHYDQCEALLSASRRISEAVDDRELDRDELQELFEEYTTEAMRLAPSLIAMPIIERLLNERISDLIELDGDRTVESFLNRVITPKHENFVVQQLDELVELGAEIQSRRGLSELFSRSTPEIVADLPEAFPEFFSRIEAHASKFEFMEIYYYEGDRIDERDIIDYLDDLLEFDCRSVVPERDLPPGWEVRDLVRDVEPPEARELVEIAREFKYLRLHRIDVLNKASGLVRDFFEAIGRRAEFSYTDLMYCTYEEIANVLHGERPPPPEVVSERQEAYATLFVDGTLELVVGRDGVDELMEDARDEGEAVENLGGMSASTGTHTGRVRIVLSDEEVGKVEKGDVLVTSTTNPNFLHAVIRAGAVVTDEGGILSHAGILARELGIPCVTATERATDVLYDGDLVRVEADDGSVSVLQRRDDLDSPLVDGVER